jgi:hypothetical protein
MALYIGDEVVCVDDAIPLDKKDAVSRMYQNWVKKNNKYIIRNILENDGIVSGILLENLYNEPIWIPLLNNFQEPAFAEWRFKKLKSAEMLVEQEVEVLEMV